jgi:hypothetical protein
MYDAANLENVRMHDIENQISAEYRYANAVAIIRAGRGGFGKPRKFSTSDPKFLGERNGALRIVLGDIIANLLDIRFGAMTEAKAH